MRCKVINFRMCDLLVKRMITPYLWPEFLFKLSNCYKGQKECLDVLHGFTTKVKIFRRIIFSLFVCNSTFLQITFYVAI